jgi:hypothetical protein
MHVIAIHDISDPQAFWAAAESKMDTLPAGTTLRSAIPSEDGSRTVCVWESDSVATVRGVVEESVGHVSKNEYFPVDAERAIGLPGATSAAGAAG